MPGKELMTYVSKKYSLDRIKLLSFLKELEENERSMTASVYIPPGQTAADISQVLESTGIEEGPEELPGIIEKSVTGGAVFIIGRIIYAVLPPFPIRSGAIFTGYEAAPLLDLVNTDYKTGIVLVHLGSYAVGYCIGEEIVTSKVGTGLVHGRTRKGGSSQQRFQRRRQKQADEFLDRVCARAVEHLSPVEKELDYIVYGGPGQTVLRLKKRCRFLQSLEEKELAIIDVPEVRRPVLEKEVGRLYSSRVCEWQEE